MRLSFVCHPCRGFLSPSTYIPTASAVGYVVSSLRDSQQSNLPTSYIFEVLKFEKKLAFVNGMSRFFCDLKFKI